jgi:hypothetical protein
MDDDAGADRASGAIRKKSPWLSRAARRFRHLFRVLALSLTDAKARRVRRELLAQAIAERGWRGALRLILKGGKNGDVL